MRTQRALSHIFTFVFPAILAYHLFDRKIDNWVGGLKRITQLLIALLAAIIATIIGKTSSWTLYTHHCPTWMFVLIAWALTFPGWILGMIINCGLERFYYCWSADREKWNETRLGN